MKLPLFRSDSPHILPCWQPLRYVGAICRLVWRPLYLRPTEAKLVVGLVTQQAITSSQTRTALCNDTRAQYSVQSKDIVAVSISFVERGWQGSANGMGPCCTKRIMKTKQLWQVWNLRTLPQRHEDYQSHTVIEFYLCVQKLTLDRKALLRVAAVSMHWRKLHCFSADYIFFQCNTTNNALV